MLNFSKSVPIWKALSPRHTVRFLAVPDERLASWNNRGESDIYTVVSRCQSFIWNSQNHAVCLGLKGEYIFSSFSILYKFFFLQEILHFHNITMLLIKLSTAINIPEFLLVYLKNHQRLGYIILKCSSRQYVGKKMHFVLIFSILHQDNGVHLTELM